MRKKYIFIIIFVIIVICITVFMIINKDNNSIDIEVQKLYEYGEYIEKMDIPPNTIVAKINDEEILFHEIECYRNSINNSIENGSKEAVGKSAFYEVLVNKFAIYMAKKYSEDSNYSLNIEMNKEKVLNEWQNGYDGYTKEEYQEKWLKVLYIEKDEIWLNENDWITYLQKHTIDQMLASKGRSILSKFSFSKPELVNDKILKEKIKEYNDIQEQQKKFIDKGQQEKAIDIASGTMELLLEIQDRYIKELLLNSDIELCVDKKELSFEVPVLYSE